MADQKKHDDKQAEPSVQDDDVLREEQKSHGTQQNRTKKEGHATQIGSGQDQQSSRTGAPAHTKR